MKRYGNLWPQVIAFSNLLLAARKAQRSKRYRDDVLAFNYDLEGNLLALERELAERSYRPGPYTTFVIYEPKRRYISAAPYRDRVVHHALCNIVEPLFDRTFIHSCYANRRGKGTHRALNHFVRLAREHRYCLRADVEKYFPSIDHALLKAKVRRKIKCKDALWLLDLIVDHSNEQEPVEQYFPGDTLLTPCERRHGLPIGNLTSQLWANVYLSDVDHAMAKRYGGRRYVRYVDDIALFSDDRDEMRDARRTLAESLEANRLRLHPVKTEILRTCKGVNFLGFRVFPDRIRVRGDNLRRARRRFRRLQSEYAAGTLTWRQVNDSMQSWVCHVSYGNTWRLRERVFNSLVFSRG